MRNKATHILLCGFIALILSFSSILVDATEIQPQAENTAPDDGFVTESILTHTLYHNHDGDENTQGACYNTVAYHAHVGNSSTNGGCFTIPTTQRVLHCVVSYTETKTCGTWWDEANDRCSRCYSTSKSTTHTDSYGHCGAPADDDGHYVVTTVYKPSCGMTEETFLGYRFDCTLHESYRLFKMELEKKVGNGSYILALNPTQVSDIAEVTSYTWNDGSTENEIEVTENALYSCTITYTDKGVSRTFSVEYDVTDFDTTPPIITDIEVIPTQSLTDSTGRTWYGKEVSIIVNATDDFSGVVAYSLGGQDWQDTNTFTVTSNGTYLFYAKDAAGNVSELYTHVVNNIDDISPNISVTLSNEQWTNNPISINYIATDNVDTSSFTYFVSEDSTLTNITGSSAITHQITQNGTYYVYAKDYFGNIGKAEITITTIDTQPPTITGVSFFYYENEEYIEVDSLANVPSTPLLYIKVVAEDTQSGLPENYLRLKYTLNGTQNTTEWTKDKTEDIFLNGSYTLQIKDNCGNTVERTFSISTLTELFEVEVIDGTNDGEILGTTIISKPYGSIVYGSELGHDNKMSTYYENYQYVGCTSCTVRMEGNVIYRYFSRPVYKLSFYNEQGSLLTTQEVKHGSAPLFLPSPQKEPVLTPYMVYTYEFEKWTDISKNNVDLTAIYSNLSLFPSYKEVEAIRTYTIVFYDADDNIISSQQVFAGDNAIEPEAPEKFGSVFIGWEGNYHAVLSDAEVRPAYLWTLGGDFTPGEPNITINESASESGDNAEQYEDIIVEDIGGEVEYLYPSQENKEATDADGFDFNAIMDALNDKINASSKEETSPTLEKVSKAVLTNIESVAPPLFGFGAAYGVLTLITHICTGAGALQCGAFGYAYIAKKVRYMQGAWLTSSDGVKYVDSLGRKVECIWNETSNKYEFFRGKKKLETVDVDELIKSLNRGDITFEAFEREIKKSKVYTSFSKDLEIEVQNVKLSSGVSKKAKGLSLTDNISKMMDVAGDYTVRLTNKGKSAIFELKYAMKQI